jgi:hypothetical protein
MPAEHRGILWPSRAAIGLTGDSAQSAAPTTIPQGDA